MSSSDSLRISEIFHSLQGESITVGLPTVFIRLTGCPLRCVYCDTTFAFKGGELRTISDIMQQVEEFSARYITVTGGEPLAQPNCLPLLTALCDKGYRVSLETSGALDISQVDSRVMIVMDLKTPTSGELEKNLWQNLQHLKTSDQIKVVIGDESDFQWIEEKIAEYNLPQICEVLLSPSWNQIEYAQLANWILAAKLNVRMQVQLHKIIWGENTRM